MAYLFSLGLIFMIANAHAQLEDVLLASERLQQLQQDVKEALNEAFGTNEVTSRFIGGNKAGRYAYPWYAYITITAHQEKIINGVILNEWTVLVPASEFRYCSPNASIYMAGAGVYKGLKKYQTRTVERFVMHPDHEDSPGRIGNNIAIAHLTEPFEINKGVAPITLSDTYHDRQFLSSENCKVVGMGYTGVERPDVIRDLKVYLYPANWCKKYAKYFFTDHWYIDNRRNVCGISEEGQICEGHLGSPVVCYGRRGKARLVGTTIEQPLSCAWPPHRFTKLAKYRRWLAKNAKGKLLM